MAIVAWEGDPGNSTPLDGFSEALRFNGTTVDDGIVVAGSDPTIQPYDGTVNTSGVATSYGVDVDTFDVTALLAPGQTSATTQFSAGGDLVLLTAQVVSATSEPVVDLSLTKTHTGNFTVGGTNVYTMTVANAAGWQREDNTVVVTDTLPAGLTYVSGVGTGWTCGAAAQVVTCTHPPTLNSGSCAAADRVDGRSDGRRGAERRQHGRRVERELRLERRERHGDGSRPSSSARISRRRRRRSST